VRSLDYAIALALTAVLASGCATRADLLKVENDQRQVRALLADTQVSVDRLRRRLEMMESQRADAGRGSSRGTRAGTRTTAELENRIAELETRLAAQQGQVPGATPPPVIGEAPGVAPGVPVTPAPGVAPPSSPTDIALAGELDSLQGSKIDDDYRDGLQLVRAGQCEQAAPKFRAFIKKSPSSDRADNAQYWIGECYYGQRDYNKAIIELNEVLLKYPKGDKVPSALLTLAKAFADSGDKIDARLILQKLISDHPKSEEAERGRQMLQSFGD
jgi:tol-pal system protein YbgF